MLLISLPINFKILVYVFHILGGISNFCLFFCQLSLSVEFVGLDVSNLANLSSNFWGDYSHLSTNVAYLVGKTSKVQFIYSEKTTKIWLNLQIWFEITK